MDNEPMNINDKESQSFTHKTLFSIKGYCVIAGLVVLVLLTALVYNFTIPSAKTAQKSPYIVVESWDIPGGQGRSIVIKPEKASEQDLFTLGELLKQESTIYTNAFVYVYDNADAANLRKVVMEGNPSQEEALKHDEHFKGIFSKVGEQGNVFDVFLSGSRGNNNKRMTF